MSANLDFCGSDQPIQTVYLSGMNKRRCVHGFTLLELLIALAVVSALLAILLPTLSTARIASHKDDCATNQYLIYEAWQICLESNGGLFPSIAVEPGWFYGGLRFSAINGSPFLDFDRPLNRYLPQSSLIRHGEEIFKCPGDTGIHGEVAGVGTGTITAFRAFGTSYRANASLLRLNPDLTESENRLSISTITTPHSKLVLMGDAVWYEVHERTHRQADWHAAINAGNVLFLDGSVKFLTMDAEDTSGSIEFDPFKADAPVMADKDD